MNDWNHPLKLMVMGIVIAGLICDASILSLCFSPGPDLAYAQHRGGRRGGGGGSRHARSAPRRGSPARGNIRSNPGRSNSRPRAGNQPRNRPEIRGGDRPGNRPGGRPGDRPGQRPGDRPGNRPGNRPGDGGRPPHNHIRPNPGPGRGHPGPGGHRGPYYGPGRPVPPRPGRRPPPPGPGPWHAGPWRGHGASPWWYGRPFLWSLTAAATVTVIAGITYHIVNGVYYRPYTSDGTTVYVQVNNP